MQWPRSPLASDDAAAACVVLRLDTDKVPLTQRPQPGARRAHTIRPFVLCRVLEYSSSGPIPRHIHTFWIAPSLLRDLACRCGLGEAAPQPGPTCVTGTALCSLSVVPLHLTLHMNRVSPLVPARELSHLFRRRAADAVARGRARPGRSPSQRRTTPR